MRIALLAAAGAVLLAGNASAATTSSNFQVTAKVVSTCNIQSATTGIAFGDYDPAGANASTADTATGTIAVRCTKGTSMTVNLEAGANAPASGCVASPTRNMKNIAASGELLSYGIYLEGTHATNWGCGAGLGATRTAAKSNVDETFTTYGRIPAGQDVPAGDYADTVTFNVIF